MFRVRKERVVQVITFIGIAWNEGVQAKGHKGQARASLLSWKRLINFCEVIVGVQ